MHILRLQDAGVCIKSTTLSVLKSGGSAHTVIQGSLLIKPPRALHKTLTSCPLREPRTMAIADFQADSNKKYSGPYVYVDVVKCKIQIA